MDGQEISRAGETACGMTETLKGQDGRLWQLDSIVRIGLQLTGGRCPGQVKHELVDPLAGCNRSEGVAEDDTIADDRIPR